MRRPGYLGNLEGFWFGNTQFGTGAFGAFGKGYIRSSGPGESQGGRRKGSFTPSPPGQEAVRRQAARRQGPSGRVRGKGSFTPTPV